MHVFHNSNMSRVWRGGSSGQSVVGIGSTGRDESTQKNRNNANFTAKGERYLANRTSRTKMYGADDVDE